eukprot:9502910-Lingulodinium_polyedra.AAC.1
MPAWLSAYFSFPSVEARALGISHLDGVAVAGSARIFPQMRVIPMGWAWALWMVQDIHASVLASAPGLQD